MASVKYEDNGLRERLKDAAGRVLNMVASLMDVEGRGAVWRMTDRVTSGRPGLFRRSGDLSKTLGHTVKRGHAYARLTVGAMKPGRGLRYAKTHEYGASEVRGHGGSNSWLALPLDAVKGADGRPKFTAAQSKSRYKNTFIKRMRTSSGVERPFIFWAPERRKKGTKVIPLFMLIDKVDIPARPFVNPEMEILRPKIRVAASEFFERLLVFGG